MILRVMVVLISLMPMASALAAAQAAPGVKREDLIGAWRGLTDLGPKHRVLWADGLWWGNHGGGRWRLSGDTLWLGDDFRYGYGGIFQRTIHAARTAKDTADRRTIPVDTVEMAWFMKYLANDSFYWTGTKQERAELYKQFYQKRLAQIDTTKDQTVDYTETTEAGFRQFLLHPFESHITAFQVSLTHGMLALLRIDSLSDSLLPGGYGYFLGAREKQGVFERTDSIAPW